MKIDIQDKNCEIEGLKTSLSAEHTQTEALNRKLEAAIESYRRLVIRANPDLPEELISGDSIEGIDESLKKARNIATRIRTEIEEAAKRNSIPAGAPVRSEENGANLSPREKIQYAMGGRP